MKCCICHKEIDPKDANNAAPYVPDGLCCDKCNAELVIPARMADIHKLVRNGHPSSPTMTA